MNAMKPTEGDLHWMAGFFDGEGHIGIMRMVVQRKRPTYALIVVVGQTNPKLLHLFLSYFGGSVTTSTPDPRRKRAFRWQITAKKAVCFLRTIRPYLRYTRKQELARLGLEFQKTIGDGKRRSESIIVLQESYWKRARELNKKGPRNEEKGLR